MNYAIPMLDSDIQKKILSDPQGLNSYAYGRNNPILFKDPDGKWYTEFFWDNIKTFGNDQSWSSFQMELGDAATILSQDSDVWNFAFSHPYVTGTGVGVISAIAADSAFGMYLSSRAIFLPDVGGYFVAGKIIQAGVGATLTYNTLKGLPVIIKDMDKIKKNKNSLKNTIMPTLDIAYNTIPSFSGEKISGVFDVVAVLTQIRDYLKGLVGNNKKSPVNSIIKPNKKK